MVKSRTIVSSYSYHLEDIPTMDLFDEIADAKGWGKGERVIRAIKAFVAAEGGAPTTQRTTTTTDTRSEVFRKPMKKEDIEYFTGKKGSREAAIEHLQKQGFVLMEEESETA